MSEAAAPAAIRGREPWLRVPSYTGFVLRALLAMAIAMYAAYWLELDNPYSAGTTVVIVAAASRGAVVSKSLWRVFGSAVGVGASVTLIACFVQAPLLFVFALAIWLGICTFLSSLLRYFRSYAAVLAGYTVTLVAIPAVGDPDRIFDLAAARLSTVVIGVGATALVFLVTDLGSAPAELERQTSVLFANVARMIRDGIENTGPATLIAMRRRIVTAFATLDQAVEYAAAEDAVFARHAGNLRVGAASLYAAVAGAERTVHLLCAPSLAGDERILAAQEAVLAVMAILERPTEGAARFAARRMAITTTRQRIAESAASCRDIPVLAALDQTIALLDQLLHTAERVSVLHGRSADGPPIRLGLYVNPVTARRNGARAAIAVSIAGIFWIVSQWPTGGSMLLLLGVVCGLLAQSDSAAAASLEFLKGTVLSSAAAFVVTFGILPQTSGYPLLLATMTPFIVIGLIGSTRPATAAMSTAFMIFFITQVAPDNPMRYDLASALNNYLAYGVGALCGVLAFRVVLPPDPAAEAMVLMRSILNAVVRAAAGSRPPVWLAWEHLQHQKLARLSLRLAADPAARAIAIGGALEAVLIGRGIIRLRGMLDDPALPANAAAAINHALPALHRLHVAPIAAAAAASAAAASLGEPETAPPIALHAAATLHEMAALLRADTTFFKACAGTRRMA